MSEIHGFPDYGRESYQSNLLMDLRIGQNGWQVKDSNGPQRRLAMRLNYLFAIVLLSIAVYAKEPKHYQSGRLIKMESVKCGTDEKNGKSLAGEMIGTDSAHMKTRELLCQQYMLETDKLIYIVQPKDDKHPALLPVGESAQFRLEKDKMLLRVEDMDSKEREYIVISMVPKKSAETTRSSRDSGPAK
jgi:hypothetical protein